MVFLKCFSLHTLPGLHHDLFWLAFFVFLEAFSASFWKVFSVEVLPGKGHPGDANDASYALYFSIVRKKFGGAGRLPGLAEAKDLTVQATTSLPLHGMAGLSEKRSAAPGGFPVAEAKDLTVQATTSLPLHGMAGLYGLRPAPAMPEQEMDRYG